MKYCKAKTINETPGCESKASLEMIKKVKEKTEEEEDEEEEDGEEEKRTEREGGRRQEQSDRKGNMNRRTRKRIRIELVPKQIE